MPTTAQLAALILAEVATPNCCPGGWRRWSWAVGPGVVQVLAARLGCSTRDAHDLLRPALDALVQHAVVEMDRDGYVRATALGHSAVRAA